MASILRSNTFYAWASSSTSSVRPKQKRTKESALNHNSKTDTYLLDDRLFLSPSSTFSARPRQGLQQQLTCVYRLVPTQRTARSVSSTDLWLINIVDCLELRVRVVINALGSDRFILGLTALSLCEYCCRMVHVQIMHPAATSSIAYFGACCELSSVRLGME